MSDKAFIPVQGLAKVSSLQGTFLIKVRNKGVKKAKFSPHLKFPAKPGFATLQSFRLMKLLTTIQAAVLTFAFAYLVYFINVYYPRSHNPDSSEFDEREIEHDRFRSLITSEIL